MQWILFAVSCVVLVTARMRGENREDFGVDLFESRRLFETENRQEWSPQYQKDLYEILDSVNEKTDASGIKVPKKRALSALSRWKPLGNLGIRIKSSHRVPSRAPMMSMIPEMNLISAESSEGVRPLGQPLRWGRKR